MTTSSNAVKLPSNGDGLTAAALDELAQRLAPAVAQHLVNCIDVGNAPLQKGSDPTMKINRVVTINGEKRWIHANTEQEYAEKLMQLCGGMQQAPAQRHNFADYANTWFDVYAKPSIEKATATTYKRQITRYLIPHFSGMAVEEITVDDVQRLFNDISGTKATKDKVKIVLNMILDAAVEDRLLDRNPLKSKRLKITGGASKVTEPYTQEEMRYMAHNLTKIVDSSDRMYFALLAFHPLRLEEVLGLKWADIDIDAGIIHVRRAVTHPDRNMPEVKDTKTAASVRDIGLSTIALPQLIPGKPDEFVCGGSNPLSYTQVRRMNDRIGKQLEFDGAITPRRFRTTVLTDLYDRTKDIKLAQSAAGHTTPTMCLKRYVKGRNNSPRAATAAIDAVYSA